jgi:hypothetical protein
MPLDYPNLVYSPVYNVFARVIRVLPLKSRPGDGPYYSRGIFDTAPIDVAAMDGAIISEQRTILDLREADFSTVPIQGDQIEVPADGGMPAMGWYEVIEAITNGGGETTVTLRKVVQADPVI